MYKNLSELIQERYMLNNKIRAIRVKNVRTMVAMAITSKKKLTKQIIHDLEKVNSMVEKVHYNHQDLDNLLDRIEDLLEEVYA